MAMTTAYSAYTNLQNGGEYSFEMSGSAFGGTCYVELMCTTFAPNCFGIPSGSKINSVTVKFQAKLSRSNTNLYAGRWGFKNFLHYERWNGDYPGFNALEQMVKNGEVDRFVDYKSNDRQHETSKLTDSYKDYSFKISDLLTITEKMLSGGLRIDLDKIYQGTLDATLYIKNFRVEVDYTPPAQYYFDLNGFIDGTSSGGISPAGTADVYINGALASNDCTDYYAQHTVGSTYEIKDIKVNTGYAYIGVKSGSLSGTITAATAVVLEFKRLPPEITDVKITYGSQPVSKLNKVPCGEGFILSVGVGYSNSILG